MVLGFAAWFVATRAQVETELSRLFPQGATPTERLLLTELRTGAAGRLILMALEGEDADLLAGASKQLATWMRKSGSFNYVGNGEEAWTKEERERLFQNRYVLSPGVRESTFSRDHLRDFLELRLSDLTSPLSPMVKELIPGDPTGEFMKILHTWMTWTAPARHQGVWFSSDLRRALLVAETHAAGFDLDSQEQLQGQIREAFRPVAETPTGAAPVQLVMTGPSVIAVEMRQTIQDDVWRLSLCATLLVTTFLFVSYGSISILALSFLPLASAILAGIVAVGLVFGFIHGMTLAFGITLLGVVDDYPIHLFSHLTRESRAPAVMKEIWPTMRLGVVATALGFSALLLSGFPGLSQLGLFAMVGLFTAACVTRWVLPHIVPIGFHTRREGLHVAQWIDALTRARLVVPLAVVIAIGSFIWSDTPLWEQDLANLSPISVEQKERDHGLRNELGAPDVRDLIVVEGSSEEEALQRSEALALALDPLVRKGELAGYDLAARYLPSRKTQQARQAAVPERETLERNLTSALKGLPFKASLFQPFLEAAGKARTQEPVDIRMFRGTALGLKLDSLLYLHEGHWVAVVPLRGVTDRQKFREFLTPWGEYQITYLDLKDESHRMVSVYRNETLRLLGWGVLSIGLVLLVGLRTPIIVLRVMLPIGSAIVVVAAVLHALGERFSLFHVASFLLVIGLGLDYALFFNRRHGTLAERGRTVYGLVVCSTTTILVFGVLALSQIPVLRAIGLTTALGSLACLVFAAFLAESPEKPPLSSETFRK
ncbi:MAG TPA: MMPL family transporter [Nitrospiraceae bacterium]|nr:MMPL family transporter [Nitrospiraceae bacterium]